MIWISTRAAFAAALLLGASVPAAAAEPLFDDGKLLLTNGVASLEGSAGGGLATWAVIAGRGSDRALGLSAHATVIEFPDYGWQSHGVALGVHDRIELSYARQNFDTRQVGAALGLGRGYRFNTDIVAAKLRLAGDLVYGPALLPAIAVSVQHKRSLDGAVVRAVGARSAHGTDVVLTASKLLLSHSLLLSGGARLTRANQFGLLGFGGDRHAGATVQFEGSAAWLASRRLAIGAEVRTRPDNLGIAREDDAFDLFVAYAPARRVTVTAAYADVGSVATFGGQRGGFLSIQIAY